MLFFSLLFFGGLSSFGCKWSIQYSLYFTCTVYWYYKVTGEHEKRFLTPWNLTVRKEPNVFMCKNVISCLQTAWFFANTRRLCSFLYLILDVTQSEVFQLVTLCTGAVDISWPCLDCRMVQTMFWCLFCRYTLFFFVFSFLQYLTY